MTIPSRPALRYYGGKWRQAAWIVSHFPPHKNYVELCGGAASVLLHKPRSPLETYNDIDSEVVNFFRVLRDQTDELMRRLRLTPWSRTEYELSRSPADDPVEAARRFFVLSWQSIHGATMPRARRSGWRFQKHDDDRGTNAVRDLVDIDHLYQIAERFRGVQLECGDALEVAVNFDSPDTLHYFDPPYLARHRSRMDRYRHEVDEQYHVQAAEVLRQLVGYVVVSGGPCLLYAGLYEEHGWRRVETNARGNSGSTRIEALWLSPRTVRALDGCVGLPLFDLVKEGVQ